MKYVNVPANSYRIFNKVYAAVGLCSRIINSVSAELYKTDLIDNLSPHLHHAYALQLGYRPSQKNMNINNVPLRRRPNRLTDFIIRKPQVSEYIY